MNRKKVSTSIEAKSTHSGDEFDTPKFHEDNKLNIHNIGGGLLIGGGGQRSTDLIHKQKGSPMRMVEAPSSKDINKKSDKPSKDSKALNYYNKSLGILKSSFSTGAASNNNTANSSVLISSYNNNNNTNGKKQHHQNLSSMKNL